VPIRNLQAHTQTLYTYNKKVKMNKFNALLFVSSFLSIVSQATTSVNAASDSFDNFVVSYGDFERCTFGIARPSPRKHKNSEATSSLPKKNKSKQSADSIAIASSSLPSSGHQEGRDGIDSASNIISHSHSHSNSKVDMVSHAVLHDALPDEVNILFSKNKSKSNNGRDDGERDDQRSPLQERCCKQEVQTVSSTTSSSPSSLASVISIGRSRRSIKSPGEFKGMGRGSEAANDRNQFGWGLHQSSGF